MHIKNRSAEPAMISVLLIDFIFTLFLHGFLVRIPNERQICGRRTDTNLLLKHFNPFSY